MPLPRRSAPARLVLVTALASGGLACSDSSGPVDATRVPYGQTTFVVFVNPAVNDVNTAAVAAPDTLRRDSTEVAVVQGPSDVTDSVGVATLSPVAPGARTLSVARDSVSGEAAVSIAERELREVAVALTPDGAAVMATVPYAFGGRVVEVRPTTPVGEVNAALAQSNVIVFLRSGTYTGDLTFSGSNVTLYGEGRRGGTVTINGNVTVNGSGNRIRGARITGGLSIPANGFGMSLSRVDGALQRNGSGATLLLTPFCGGVTSPTTNVTALGNSGMSPIARSPGC